MSENACRSRRMDDFCYRKRVSIMANEKKVVLVACGTGIATSTVVNTALENLAKENGLQVEIIQCKMMEVPGYADRADLLITTTVVDKDQYKFQVINGRPFLTGMGLDKVKAEILAELQK